MREITETIVVFSAIFIPVSTATVFFLRESKLVSLNPDREFTKHIWLLPTIAGAIVWVTIMLVLFGPPMRFIDTRILLFPLFKNSIAIAASGIISFFIPIIAYEGIKRLQPIAKRISLTVAPILIALPILGIQLTIFSEKLVGIPGDDPNSVPITNRASVEVITSGIRFPTSLSSDSKGRLIVTDYRSGEIWLITPDTDGIFSSNLLTRVPLPEGMHGHHGLWYAVLDPNEHYLYAFAIESINQDNTKKSGDTSRIVRFSYNNGQLGPMEVLIPGLPSAESHAGGAMAFGLDGNLYLTIGDVYLHNQPQAPRGITGSILRYTPEGDIPTDNPFPGSPVYAYGFKNPYGLAFHPDNGQVYATDNMSACCDQLKIVVRGKFHGWPGYWTRPSHAKDVIQGVIPPIFDSGTSRIAPAQLIAYGGNQYGEQFKGNLFFTATNSGSIYRVVLSENGKKMENIEVIWQSNPQRPIVAITEGPDGHIYFGGIDGIFRIQKFD